MSDDESAGFHITSFITDTHTEMTHYVICPVCGGRIGFNLIEIEDNKSKGKPTSIYCAGREHPTTGGGDPNNHYHPSYPPEPIYKFNWG